KSCREVWGFPDRCVLPRVAGPDRFPNDHQPRCDANPNMQWFAARSRPADCGSNGKTGPHSPFGIGLPSFRPAEIDQHAVTDVPRNEAVKLLDGCGDARLIGADDLSQI